MSRRPGSWPLGPVTISCVRLHAQASLLRHYAFMKGSVLRKPQVALLTSALVPLRRLGSSPPLIAPFSQFPAQNPFAKAASKAFHQPIPQRQLDLAGLWSSCWVGHQKRLAARKRRFAHGPQSGSPPQTKVSK